MNKCFRLVGLLSFLKNKWNNSKHNKTSLSSRTIKFPYPITLRLIVFLVLSFISSYIFLKHHKVFYKQTSSSSSLHKQVQQIHLLLLVFPKYGILHLCMIFRTEHLKVMPVDISGFLSSHKYIINNINNSGYLSFFRNCFLPIHYYIYRCTLRFRFQNRFLHWDMDWSHKLGKNGTVEWTWNNKTSIKKRPLCTQANKKSKVYGHFAIKPCSGASPFDAQI